MPTSPDTLDDFLCSAPEHLISEVLAVLEYAHGAANYEANESPDSLFPVEHQQHANRAKQYARVVALFQAAEAGVAPLMAGNKDIREDRPVFDAPTTPPLLRALQVATLLIVAVAGLTYLFRDRPTSAQLRALDAATTGLMKSSEGFLKPVETAAVDGMAAHLATIQAKQEEIRQRQAAEKIDSEPKAYRWKDATGQWHLSDAPPAPELAVEIIPLERMK